MIYIYILLLPFTFPKKKLYWKMLFSLLGNRQALTKTILKSVFMHDSFCNSIQIDLGLKKLVILLMKRWEPMMVPNQWEYSWYNYWAKCIILTT